MKLLLDGRYAPLTTSIGFVEAEPARVVATFSHWYDSLAGPVVQHEAHGPLAHALEALPPLVRGRCRFLLAPTDSQWTAYFDNAVNGSDAAGPMAVLCRRLRCRTMRVTAAHDTLGTKSTYDKTKRGEYGASIFELFEPGPEGDPATSSSRSICAMNDGGRWSFDAIGTPLPFEQPAAYTARRKRDKFPFELLDTYCRALGIRPFDADFYIPPGHPATLVEVPGLCNHVRSFTLAEVQAGEPWHGPRDDGSPR